MPRQTSLQVTEATDRQVEALKLAGFGSLTDIIRIAVDRMYRDECGQRLNRIELWQHRTSGERYAVLADRGRPIAASGPLSTEDAKRIMAGDTAIAWDEALADAINEQDEQAGDAAGAYRWVMGADGKPRRVTGIGYWTRRTRFLEIDGAPDGVMFNNDLVEVAEARRPQEVTP